MQHEQHIVAIGAHPDDIEYGCLGTLIKFSWQYVIDLVIFTDGELGGPRRRAESTQAFESVGLNSIFWLGLADGYFTVDAGTVGKLEPLLQKATTILTMSACDTHQDHRAVWQTTMAAARRRAVTLLSYQSISSTPDFNARLFVDITREYPRKLQALQCHETQAEKEYMKESWLAEWHKHPQAMTTGQTCVEAFNVHQAYFL